MAWYCKAQPAGPCTRHDAQPTKVNSVNSKKIVVTHTAMPLDTCQSF